MTMVNRRFNYLAGWAQTECPTFFAIFFPTAIPLGVVLMEKTYQPDPEMQSLVIAIEEKIATSNAAKEYLDRVPKTNYSPEYVDTVYMPALRSVVNNTGSDDQLECVKKRFALYECMCKAGDFCLVAN